MHNEGDSVGHGQDGHTGAEGFTGGPVTTGRSQMACPPELENGELIRLRVELDLAQLDHPSRWAKISR